MQNRNVPLKLGLAVLSGLLLLSFLSCNVETTPPVPSVLPGPSTSKLDTVEKDVIYGNVADIDLKLDIYYPKAATKAVPAVVHVHGGGWTEGNKANGECFKEIRLLVQRGYLVASVDYRLAPQYKFPAQIEDVKCAVRFLKANAARYGIDPEKIGAMGSSAGGQLVSLLGTTNTSDGLDGAGAYDSESSRVQAVVDRFGASDLTTFYVEKNYPWPQSIFGPDDAEHSVARLASPVTYISPDDPPFLIIHGDKDELVFLSQSRKLYEQLLASGVPVTLVVVKNAGHYFKPANGTISPTLDEIATITADFFDKYLK
jgi:acetyl esterase/lipase